MQLTLRECRAVLILLSWEKTISYLKSQHRGVYEAWLSLIKKWVCQKSGKLFSLKKEFLNKILWHE